MLFNLDLPMQCGILHKFLGFGAAPKSRISLSQFSGKFETAQMHVKNAKMHAKTGQKWGQKGFQNFHLFKNSFRTFKNL